MEGVSLSSDTFVIFEAGWVALGAWLRKPAKLCTLRLHPAWSLSPPLGSSKMCNALLVGLDPLAAVRHQAAMQWLPELPSILSGSGF